MRWANDEGRTTKDERQTLAFVFRLSSFVRAWKRDLKTLWYYTPDAPTADGGAIETICYNLAAIGILVKET